GIRDRNVTGVQTCALPISSTYDHRIIQGAQSGEFLRIVHQKLLGQDGFYDRIFAALRVPYEPVRWTTDISGTEEDELTKPARVEIGRASGRGRGWTSAEHE